MEISPQWVAIGATIVFQLYTHYVASKKDIKSDITKLTDEFRQLELGYTELKTRFEYGVLAQTRRAARESHEDSDSHELDNLLERYERGLLDPTEISELMNKIETFIRAHPDHQRCSALQRLLDGLTVLYMPVETLQRNIGAAMTRSLEADRRHMQRIVDVISRLG